MPLHGHPCTSLHGSVCICPSATQCTVTVSRTSSMKTPCCLVTADCYPLNVHKFPSDYMPTTLSLLFGMPYVRISTGMPTVPKVTWSSSALPDRHLTVPRSSHDRAVTNPIHRHISTLLPRDECYEEHNGICDFETSFMCYLGMVSIVPQFNIWIYCSGGLAGYLLCA
jgi:hypothetical protein